MTAHTHRPLDIEVMLGLHTKVNIIPVIAKVILISCTYDKRDFLSKRMLILKITNLFQADTFTAVERKQFKEKVGDISKLLVKKENWSKKRIEHQLSCSGQLTRLVRTRHVPPPH